MFQFTAAAGFIILFTLGIYVIYKSNGQVINLAVGLWLFSTAAWSLGQMFMIISSSIEGLLYPIQLSFVGIFLMGSSTLHLALTYPIKRNILEKKGILYLIYLPAALFSILILSNNYHSLFISTLSYNQDSILNYSLSYGLLGQIAKIFPYLFITISILIFFQSALQSKGGKKKGAQLLCLGIIIGLFSSVLSEFKIMPATTLFPISGLIFVVATLKYRAMILTPTTAAENILKTMNDALILTDVKNKILKINNSVIKILGFTEKDLVSKNISSLFTHHKNIIYSKDFQQLKKGNIINNYNDQIVTKDGEKRIVSINASPIQDQEGIINGYVYNIRDVTHQKKAERKLRESKQKLEDINHKLNKRKSEVETLLKQKDELIHLLAHDLKNPLNTPLNLLPVIEKKVNDKDSKKMVRMSLKSISTIQRIIDETLQIAKYENSKDGVHLQKISMADIVERVLENNENIIQENQFSVETSIDKNLTIIADEFQLEEVFTNLISNAIKYTPEENNGIITINATKQADSVLVSIQDNGMGLSNEEKKHVFKKFYKSAKPRQGMESTGLGLGICKNIIEHHKGSIWVESQGIDKGSTFYFTLPIHQDTKSTQAEDETNDIEQKIDQLLND